MFQLRRSAQRLLANPSTSFAVRTRSITSISRPSFKINRQTTFAPSFQRRWASEEVRQDEEKPEGETPVEKVEPSPQQEAENAVAQEGSKPSETSAERPGTVGAIFDSAKETVKNAASTVRDTVANPDSQIKTLYVGNLFFDVSEQDLTNEFKRFGEVETVNLIRDGRGLSRGYGYVAFAKAEDAREAKETMDQTVFEGRRMTAQFAQRQLNARSTSATNAPSKTLFIGNMSFDMTDRDLNSLFKGIKNVIDVRVAIDRRTGQPRGFAHADFLDIKSAVEAQKVLKDKEVYGRKLRVDFSQTTARGGPRDRASGEAPQR